MYRVYWNHQTGSFLPLALLAKAGAPVERKRVDTRAGAHRSPDYLRLNPMGQLPTLVLPDGSVLTETAAMLLHLCEAFPDSDLAPPPEPAARARFYRWVAFGSAVLYETALRFYYPERYTLEPEGAEGVKGAAGRRLGEASRILAEHGLRPGPYVLGERFSAADLYLAMIARWLPDGGHPALSALIERTRTDAVLGPLWAEILEPPAA